jgi:hypothetical protein
MKQKDPSFGPDLAGLQNEALALQQHPNFDRALAAFCSGMVGFHTGRRLANIGLGHTLGWAISVLVIYLDHAAPEGTTAAQLVKLCTSGSLSGAKAVKGSIRVLLALKLVEKEAHRTDRRAKRLRPSELLLQIHHDNIVARLTALEFVQPLPQPAIRWGRERSVLLSYFGGNTKAFARSKFRLYDGFPEIRAFMDRASGYPILLDILNSVTATTNGGIAATASPSAIAARFDISRAHVRKLLAMACDNGWMEFQKERNQILIERNFHQRLRHWIALEFVWIWRLVRPDHSV